MKNVKELIEGERKWLSTHPPFNPNWEDGVSVIHSRLGYFAHKYSESLLSCAPSQNTVQQAETWIWRVWVQRWRVSVAMRPGEFVDGLILAQELADGIGQSLGWNAFRDAALVAATLAGEERAVHVFDSEYRGLFLTLARRLLGREPDFDFWGDFLTRLAFSPGLLTNYSGLGSLRAWMLTVARHYMIDSLKRVRRHQSLPPAEGVDWVQPNVELLDREVIADKLMAEMTQAVRYLEPRERAVLFLHFAKDWPNNAIASHLGVSSGHVSRLREEALLSIRKRLSEESRYLGQSLDEYAIELLCDACFSDIPRRAASIDELFAHAVDFSKLKVDIMSKTSDLAFETLADESVRPKNLKSAKANIAKPPLTPLPPTPRSLQQSTRPAVRKDVKSADAIDLETDTLASQMAIGKKTESDANVQILPTEFYEPLRVVLVAKEFLAAAGVADRLRVRRDVHWLGCDVSDTDPKQAYLALLSQELERFVGAVGAVPVSDVEVAVGTPVGELVSGRDKRAWEESCLNIQEVEADAWDISRSVPSETLLPQAEVIHFVTLEVAPEEEFKRLSELPFENRPTILGLDARNAKELVLAEYWQTRLDEAIARQYASA